MFKKTEIQKQWWFIRDKNKIFYIDTQKNIQVVELHDELIEAIDIKKYKILNEEWNIKVIETDESKAIEREEQINQIDKETKQKILEKYSQTDQTNLTREATRVIWEIALSKQEPTEEQLLILQRAKEADVYIKTTLEEWRKQRLSLNE
jgi:Mg/Co/Ni transporter MgtE